MLILHLDLWNVINGKNKFWGERNEEVDELFHSFLWWCVIKADIVPKPKASQESQLKY